METLTTAQAATILGVQPRIVRRYCQQGRLPAECRIERGGPVYYIASTDLAAFAQQPRPQGRPPKPPPADS